MATWDCYNAKLAFILSLMCLAAHSANGSDEAGVIDEETARQLAETWTKVFFSMGRVPRNGTEMLIFPGLFDKGVEGSPVASDSNPIIMTNDGRLFVQHRDQRYVFDDVESLDEERRQRRRLRSASRHHSIVNNDEFDLLAVDEEHISSMIDSVFSTPRDFLTNETVRAGVVRYVTQKMRSFGLVTGNQLFDPQEFAELFEGHMTNGTNVIGILPGELWGTKDDEVLVIGAHWDTVPNSGGMDDNGSGVTAVLEVARAMTEGGCRPRHSIIFVAFDLEEVGCLGSIYFVRDFLIPQVLEAHGAKMRGAFILDTIMNYNETQFSQDLSPEWQRALPAFWSDLQAENRTGNFLALMYRKEVDASLASSFAFHWRGDAVTASSKKISTKNPRQEIPKRFRVNNKEITIVKADLDTDVETIKTNSSKYRLKKVRLNLASEVGERLELLTPWVDLLRSDHSRFWYHSIEGYPKSLPAVLITDTAPYRGVMQKCYHQECDSSTANRQLKFGNIKFLAKTCQTLIDTLVSLSDARCLFKGGKGPVQRPGNPRPFMSLFSSAATSSTATNYLTVNLLLVPLLAYYFHFM